MTALTDARADLTQVQAEIANREAAGRLPSRAMYELLERRHARVAAALAEHHRDIDASRAVVEA